MSKLRKIAVLAMVAALALLPTGAKATALPVLRAGSLSIVMTCSTEAQQILSLGSKEFDLTDVTIANADSSLHTVAITNGGTVGVAYAANASSTVTQTFETPIRFVAAINNPVLVCDSTTTKVTVSIQGVVP